MIRILASGFSFLIILISCTAHKKMSHSLNKNVLPDVEGKIYYRDFKNAIEVRYFGDYSFTSFSKKKTIDIFKKWGIRLTSKDTGLFLASTNIAPFYKSAIIKLSLLSSGIPGNCKEGMNIRGSDFLYIDTVIIAENKFAFLFWGDYLTSFPNTPDIDLLERKLFPQIEANEIRETISFPNKIFFNDISSIAYNSLLAKSQNELNYLAPIVRLSEYRNKNLKREEENYLFQMLSIYHSFFCDSDSAIFYYRKAFSKKFSELNLADTNLVSAKERVLELARGSRIILINEVHSDVRNRNFLRLILPDLFELGYEILAAEAVSQDDSLLNIRKYPVGETGFYTKEPVFASLIKSALSKGFTVVGYDYFPDCVNCVAPDPYCCINRREEGQANNLSEIINKNPDKKVIVFGGHDHIYKATPQKGFKTMAMYLAEMGYSFVSIDQVKGFFYSLPNTPNRYLSVKDNSLLPKSFTNYEADTYIIAPYPFEQKQLIREYDIRTIELRQVIPEGKHKKRYYVKVFSLNDSLQAGAVPVFISEIKSGSKKIHLPLARGKYLLRFLDISKIVSEQKVNIE